MSDYNPEIDIYLKIICFPTFPGHCGCLLFDISQLQFAPSSAFTRQTLAMYFQRIEPEDAEWPAQAQLR